MLTRLILAVLLAASVTRGQESGGEDAYDPRIVAAHLAKLLADRGLEVTEIPLDSGALRAELAAGGPEAIDRALGGFRRSIALRGVRADRASGGFLLVALVDLADAAGAKALFDLQGVVIKRKDEAMKAKGLALITRASSETGFVADVDVLHTARAVKAPGAQSEVAIDSIVFALDHVAGEIKGVSIGMDQTALRGLARAMIDLVRDLVAHPEQFRAGAPEAAPEAAPEPTEVALTDAADFSPEGLTRRLAHLEPHLAKVVGARIRPLPPVEVAEEARIDVLGGASALAIYHVEARVIYVCPARFQLLAEARGDEVPTRQGCLDAVLLHELVHAWQMQRFTMEQAPADGVVWSRRRVLDSAVREGHAQYAARLAARPLGVEPWVDVLAHANVVEPPRPILKHFGGLAAFASSVRGMFELSYVDGERFIAALTARLGAEQGVIAAFEKPPGSAFEVVRPELYGRDTWNADDLVARLRPLFAHDPAVLEELPLTPASLRSDLDGADAVLSAKVIGAARDGVTLSGQIPQSLAWRLLTLIELDGPEDASSLLEAWRQSGGREGLVDAKPLRPGALGGRGQLGDESFRRTGQTGGTFALGGKPHTVAFCAGRFAVRLQSSGEGIEVAALHRQAVQIEKLLRDL